MELYYLSDFNERLIQRKKLYNTSLLVDERFKSATDREDIKQRVYSLNSNLMRMDEVDSEMSLSVLNVIKTVSICFCFGLNQGGAAKLFLVVRKRP